MPDYQQIEETRIKDQKRLERTLGDEVSNALCVFLLDPKLRVLLETIDPMAIRQARDALGLLKEEA